MLLRQIINQFEIEDRDIIKMQGFSPVASPPPSSFISSNSSTSMPNTKPRHLPSMGVASMQSAYQSALRSQNMNALMSTINSKLRQNSIFQFNKNEIFEQQCENIQQKLEQQRNQAQQLRQVSSKVISDGLLQCQTNCQQLNLAYELDRINVIESFQVAINQIKQQSASRLQLNLPSSIKQNSIFLIKSLQTLKKSHTESLRNISDDVAEQLDNLEQLLNQNRQQRQQKQSKLRYMIQNLMVELEQAVHKQTSLGTIVYDSLLTTLDGLYQKIGHNASINCASPLTNVNLKDTQSDYQNRMQGNPRNFGNNLCNSISNSSVSKSKSVTNMHASINKFSGFDYTKY